MAVVMSFEALPLTREGYDAALPAKDITQHQADLMPYAFADGWQQLVKDFGYRRAATVGAKTAPSEAGDVSPAMCAANISDQAD